MPTFYPYTSSNSIGSQARVLVCPNIGSYAHSQRLQEFVDLATYLPMTSTYGWVDVGMTKTPTTIQQGTAKQDWRSEQAGLYRESPTDWSGQVKSDFLEVTPANKAVLLRASRPADLVVGEARSYLAALTDLPYLRLAILHVDQNNRIHLIYLPKAQWDGTQIQSSIGRGQQRSIPMQWMIFPDDTLPDPVTGLPSIRMDVDQTI